MRPALKRMATPEEMARLWANVDRSGGPDACWPHLKARGGHGMFKFSDGHSAGVHRLAWQEAHGVLVPDGMVVRHTCDNAPCCNPKHLETGTQEQNARDKVERGRSRNSKPSEVRHCERCGDAYEQRSGELLERFRNRRFCSARCQRLYVRATRDATAPDRFWSYVTKTDACWTWNGTKNKLGYGGFKYEGRRAAAHRVAYQLTHAVQLKEWEFVCHACDNPSCVRPDHLFVGSAYDNAKDRDSKGRNKFKRQLGIAHGMAIFTEDDIRDIRAEYSRRQGELSPFALCKDIASRYKTSGTNIRNVVECRTWRHVA